MIPIIVIILAITAANARTFNNPILEGRNYYFPGAIKVNGTYYIVLSSSDQEIGSKLPVFMSTDLVNWTSAGRIFSGLNYPAWASTNTWFFSPEIHKIGNSYNIYYSALRKEPSRMSIGVAIATDPLGPYVSTDRPLLEDSSGEVRDPTIINDNGSLYLLWKSGGTILGRPLSSNGLTYPSSKVTEVLRPDLSWEHDNVEGPWYVRRGDYHYIIYSGYLECFEDHGVGVARSRNPLGPYEKKGAPFFVNSTDFDSPNHISIVKDLDDESDVIVSYAYRKGTACAGAYPEVIILASMGWSSDDWPYVYDF